MALTHRIVKRIDLEHEPGAWIEARMPSLAILDKASLAAVKRQIEIVAGIDLQALQGLTSGKTAGDGATSYDWQTLLVSCVKVWSYDAPVTPENVAELDEQTVNAVLAVLVPRETETERKNA